MRVRAGVRHGQPAGAIERQRGNDLVLELVAGISGAIASGVSALDHEIGNDAVEDRSVVERHAVLAGPGCRAFPIFGAAGQSNEVSYGFRSFLFVVFASKFTRRCVENGGRLSGCGSL